MPHEPLPSELGTAFPVHLARAYGVTRQRLRGRDLRAPFHGIRHRDAPTPPPADADPYSRQRHERVAAAREYAPGLHTGHFFSHETAASIWGAPLPIELDPTGAPASGDALALHVCARGAVPLPRARGITRHRTLDRLTSMRDVDGLRVSSPATTWAALGHLPLGPLVALGDYFCRQWRPGIGRPTAGRAPLATVDELRAALDAGRRRGAARLRAALERVREDSWSPRESQVRCLLVDGGLPEPQLNIDVFDSAGRFLACVDLAYPVERVAIEYHGFHHGAEWARDVERAAALRAAGWVVIEVTAELLRDPDRLLRRVIDALGR